MTPSQKQKIVNALESKMHMTEAQKAEFLELCSELDLTVGNLSDLERFADEPENTFKPFYINN